MFKTLASYNGFIMRVFLAFVLLWFGVSEMLDSSNWVSYIPPFVSRLGIDSNFLVQIHGLILVVLSICLIFEVYLRYTVFVAVVVLLQITLGVLLISRFEINEIVVRDIGILGLAIGIWLGELRAK